MNSKKSCLFRRGCDSSNFRIDSSSRAPLVRFLKAPKRFKRLSLKLLKVLGRLVSFVRRVVRFSRNFRFKEFSSRSSSRQSGQRRETPSFDRPRNSRQSDTNTRVNSKNFGLELSNTPLGMFMALIIVGEKSCFRKPRPVRARRSAERVKTLRPEWAVSSGFSPTNLRLIDIFLLHN